MKKIGLIVLLALLSVTGYCQFPNTAVQGSPTTLIDAKGGFIADSVIIISKKIFADTTAANFSYAAYYSGSLIQTAGGLMWYRTLAPNKWNQFATASGGVVTLTAQKPLYLTGTASNPIENADTGRMILQLATGGVINKVRDSLSQLISTKGSGTVYSIVTNNGSGITGGPITTSGTLAADTIILSTRAYVDAQLANTGAATIWTRTGGTISPINGQDTVTAKRIVATSDMLSSNIFASTNITSNGILLGNGQVYMPALPASNPGYVVTINRLVDGQLSYATMPTSGVGSMNSVALTGTQGVSITTNGSNTAYSAIIGFANTITPINIAATGTGSFSAVTATGIITGQSFSGSGAGLTGIVTTFQGTAGQISTTGTQNIVASLADVSGGGTFGSSTQIPIITVDTKGRVISAALTTVSSSSISISLTGTNGITITPNGTTSPYSAIIGMFDATPNTVTPTPLSSAPAYSFGKIWTDINNGTTSIYTTDPGGSLQVGYEARFLIYNNTGSTLGNGVLVAMTGSIGEIPTVTLATATSLTGVQMVCLTTQAILNGMTGSCTGTGTVHNLSTTLFTMGQKVYASTVAGAFTSTAPSAPNYTLLVGQVGVVSGLTGTVTIFPSTAYLSTGLVTGVTSLTGTNNQIVASATTGAVVLSLPSVLVTPGSATVTGKTTTTGMSNLGNETIAGTLNVTGTITGTLATAAQPNITSVGTLTAVTTTGTITAVGLSVVNATFTAMTVTNTAAMSVVTISNTLTAKSITATATISAPVMSATAAIFSGLSVQGNTTSGSINSNTTIAAVGTVNGSVVSGISTGTSSYAIQSASGVFASYGFFSNTGYYGYQDVNHYTQYVNLGANQTGLKTHYSYINVFETGISITGIMDRTKFIQYVPFIPTQIAVGIAVTPSPWDTANNKVIDLNTAGAIYGTSTGFGATSNIYFDGTNWKYKTSTLGGLISATGGDLIYSTVPTGTAGNTATLTEKFHVYSTGYSSFIPNVGNYSEQMNIYGNAPNGVVDDISLGFNASSGSGTSPVRVNTGRSAWAITPRTSNADVNSAIYFAYQSVAGVNSLPLSITATGAATFLSSVTATSFTTSSDARLKNEKQRWKSKDGIDFLKYTLKSDNSVHYGYFAQEVAKILPSTVIAIEDSTMSDGKRLALNYTEILSYKNQQLEERINKVEAYILILEKQIDLLKKRKR